MPTHEELTLRVIELEAQTCRVTELEAQLAELTSQMSAIKLSKPRASKRSLTPKKRNLKRFDNVKHGLSSVKEQPEKVAFLDGSKVFHRFTECGTIASTKKSIREITCEEAIAKGLRPAQCCIIKD